MEGSGTCVACGSSDVELNKELKCAHCGGAEATPAEAPVNMPEEAPSETPAEGGDMPVAE